MAPFKTIIEDSEDWPFLHDAPDTQDTSDVVAAPSSQGDGEQSSCDSWLVRLSPVGKSTPLRTEPRLSRLCSQPWIQSSARD